LRETAAAFPSSCPLSLLCPCTAASQPQLAQRAHGLGTAWGWSRTRSQFLCKKTRSKNCRELVGPTCTRGVINKRDQNPNSVGREWNCCRHTELWLDHAVPGAALPENFPLPIPIHGARLETETRAYLSLSSTVTCSARTSPSPTLRHRPPVTRFCWRAPLRLSRIVDIHQILIR
jgi:hypothetical protein